MARTKYVNLLLFGVVGTALAAGADEGARVRHEHHLPEDNPHEFDAEFADELVHTGRAEYFDGDAKKAAKVKADRRAKREADEKAAADAAAKDAAKAGSAS